MKKAAFLLSGLLLLTAGTSFADCTVKLHLDIGASKESIRITGQGKTLYEIRRGGYLSIAGKDTDLTASQRAMTEAYAGEVAAFVPRWIAMVSEALELTENSLILALGPDSNASIKATRAVAQARENFEHRAIPRDGEYRLWAADYNDLEGSLETELEDAFSSAMSAVLAEIGRSLTSDEGSLLQKMDAFAAHMRRLGDAVGNTGVILEETGTELCTNMAEIKRLEQRIAKEISQLAVYPLFD